MLAVGIGSGAAQTQHHHHGGGGGGFGPGFVGGLALGAAVGGPYYYGGPYAYDYGPYAYAGDCYVVRRVFINRWGHRIVRHVRVAIRANTPSRLTSQGNVGYVRA